MASREIARKDDRFIGVCVCHSSPIVIGGDIEKVSSNSYCEGKKIARLHDRVRGDCGHTGFITSSASKSYCEGELIARKGDTVGNGCIVSGTIVTGASNSFCED